MDENIDDILKQPQCGVFEAKGTLARLFRTILYERGIDGPKWEVFMQRFLDDPRNPAPKNSKDRSSLKGNLNKALKADDMTWKVFKSKALKFIGAKSVRVEVHLTWYNDKTTVHGVSETVGGFLPEDYEIDQDGCPIIPSYDPNYMEKLKASINEPATQMTAEQLEATVSAALTNINNLIKAGNL